MERLEEKIKFFQLLKEFYYTDNKFFKEQCDDLLPKEKEEFYNWLVKDTEQKQIIKSMLDVIERLLKQKSNS